MADFCKECSLEHFDKDFGDLKGLGDGTPLKPGFGHLCICEGCGSSFVDDEGICIDPNCPKHGERNMKAWRKTQHEKES